MSIIKCPIPGCDYEIGDEVPNDCKNTVLQLHLQYHQSEAAQPAKAEKLKRPCLSIDNSTEEWNYFVSRWENYKQATGLTAPNTTTQLIECCDETLRKDLTRVHQMSLYKLNEEDLLKAIKRLERRNYFGGSVQTSRLKTRQRRANPFLCCSFEGPS